jgi:UDP-N-acetyl-D-mannosaminuronate dehydrogenase
MRYVQAAADLVNDRITATLGFRLPDREGILAARLPLCPSMARVSREMPRLGHGGACVTTVVVVGLGYVGLPLALGTAEVGHRVAGYDTDKARVKSLKAGESYVEDVPSGELKQALEGGMFRPSADAGVCAGFDVAVVATPTPLRDGLPDLTYLEDSARTLARYLRPGATVVV